jgi:hypothetical protein
VSYDLPDHEDVILSVIPAPPGPRPLLILSIFQDPDGWWQGWAEPVLFAAIVERRWYTERLHDLPGDPRARRRFLRERERRIEVCAYDPNALGGLAPLSEIVREAGDSGLVEVLPADAEWEDVVEAIRSAQRRARPRPSLKQVSG